MTVNVGAMNPFATSVNPSVTNPEINLENMGDGAFTVGPDDFGSYSNEHMSPIDYGNWSESVALDPPTFDDLFSENLSF